MARPRRTDTTVGFRCSLDLSDRIKQLAAEDDRAPSAFLRRLVEAALPKKAE